MRKNDLQEARHILTSWTRDLHRREKGGDGGLGGHPRFRPAPSPFFCQDNTEEQRLQLSAYR